MEQGIKGTSSHKMETPEGLGASCGGFGLISAQTPITSPRGIPSTQDHILLAIYTPLMQLFLHSKVLHVSANSLLRHTLFLEFQLMFNYFSVT